MCAGGSGSKNYSAAFGGWTATDKAYIRQATCSKYYYENDADGAGECFWVGDVDHWVAILVKPETASMGVLTQEDATCSMWVNFWC